jgi:Trk-type K+ transport system membrane component
MSSVVRAVKLLNSLHGTTKGKRTSASGVVKASLASRSFYKFLGGAGLLMYASGFKFSHMNIEQGSSTSARREVGSISRFELSVEQVNCCRNLTPTSVFSRPITELN